MNPLFDTLPGIEMPVPEVTRQIAAMWREEDQESEHGSSNAHALQMNLIIHLGIETGVEEGRGIFDVAIEFSQRYPCRIIVLCPEEPTGEEIALDAKLYSQCFLSKDLRERCCCEALMLGYGIDEALFLEDQISVWMASDLPVYHWLHRASVDLLNANYQHFIDKATRVVLDSAIDNHGYEAITCVRSGILSDLAKARTARLRQSLGQFLAATPPRYLIQNLSEVTISSKPIFKAEAQRLLAWQQDRLQHCAEKEEMDRESIEFRLVELPAEAATALESKWGYEDDKRLSWKLPEGSEVAWAKTASNGQSREHPLRADPFKPAKALSEALFF